MTIVNIVFNFLNLYEKKMKNIVNLHKIFAIVVFMNYLKIIQIFYYFVTFLCLQNEMKH